MKKYVAPVMQVNELEVFHMIAESIAINNGETVDGGNALSKEGDIWNNNIWDD